MERGRGWSPTEQGLWQQLLKVQESEGSGSQGGRKKLN